MYSWSWTTWRLGAPQPSMQLKIHIQLYSWLFISSVPQSLNSASCRSGGTRLCIYWGVGGGNPRASGPAQFKPVFNIFSILHLEFLEPFSETGLYEWAWYCCNDVLPFTWKWRSAFQSRVRFRVLTSHLREKVFWTFLCLWNTALMIAQCKESSGQPGMKEVSVPDVECGVVSVKQWGLRSTQKYNGKALTRYLDFPKSEGRHWIILNWGF